MKPVKALFLRAETPYDDFSDIIQIARAEATKVLKDQKVKVLNILQCPYPAGYVAVVQGSGGKSESKQT